jgi:hypothetical protein
MPVSTVLINNQPVLFEVEDRQVPVLVEDGGEFQGADGIIERATDLGSFIQRACVQLYGAVKQAADVVKPTEVELTFGVTLGGEAGIPFVAKGTAEANVAITLKWSPQQEVSQGDGKTPRV